MVAKLLESYPNQRTQNISDTLLPPSELRRLKCPRHDAFCGEAFLVNRQTWELSLFESLGAMHEQAWKWKRLEDDEIRIPNRR